MKTKNKILIVDDIELNRAILSELFKDTYDICEAKDGIDALEMIVKYKESIVIILLDIVMPRLDGFGVLQEMQKMNLAGLIPVVFITSENSDTAMQKAYEVGATDIINKPFSPNVIKQRISNIVEQYTYRINLEKLVEEQTQSLRLQAKKLHENSASMIDILSAVIEFKNAESVGHIQNIRKLTLMLMKKLAEQHKEYNITDDMITLISEAAAMHDIGKIAVPDNILNKPGKLTPEEFEIMKTHSVRGCEILEKLASVQYLDYYDYCYEICRHHHERWDGKGYPDALVGNQTPIWAQVVSLADVYDALTSKRVYKAEYSANDAIKMILAGECGKFNPVLIDCFMGIVPCLLSGRWLECINNSET
ncbi:MAG: response regulator [Oscillospiraceae bacterium]